MELHEITRDKTTLLEGCITVDVSALKQAVAFQWEQG
jgi:hypothetical protein